MAKIKIVLFTYKKYKDGSSPIMLRVTKGKQPKYFKIGDERFNIKEEQWNKESGLINVDKKKKDSNIEFLNNYIKEKHLQATRIVEKFEENGIAWTFNMLEDEYRHKPKITKVKPFIEARILELQNQGRYNSSNGLKGVLDTLEKFDPKLNRLYFQDIDYKFIDNLFNHLKNNRGNNDTTIGIKLRGVRGILNEAINQGVGSRETYPFSKLYGATKIFKISRLEKRAHKRSIPKEFMLRLVNSDILEPHLNWATQIFLFSFFASGINFKDMAFLKEENIESKFGQDDIESEYIEFKRRKTNENIRIPVTLPLRKILIWAKGNSTSQGEYLLPIITNSKLKGEKLNNHINQRRKRLNMHLKTVAKKLEFPEALLKLSSYYARHSYASTMLRNGAQVEKISEALGHTSIKTTQYYLESFGTDEIAKFNEDLLK
jgi:integrase/recombinase XerD